MSLNADLGLTLGELELEVELDVATGELVVLLGPNGAGKTTLLRALAGLVPLARGRVVLDGTVLDDVAAAAHVPTERRPIGFVFQDYLLFPHLSVLENVAFGLRARGLPRAEARRRAAGWLERVGLAGHAGARPRALSGGQAQRVALARALVSDPRLLLLDEPLAALDAATRTEVRRDLRRHLASFDGTRLLVTHDPLEAMALADRLVVLEDGRVTQTGGPAEVSQRPRSRYVAELVGVNLYRGRAAGATVRLADGILVAAGDYHGEVFAAVHPHAVALHRQPPEGTPRNVWAGTADTLDVVGDRVRVRVTGPVPVVAEVTPAAAAELRLADGGPVWASVKATEVTVYPA
ncbi:MAG TPA: ATP-binding cassette domain-containing protein [Actinomycetes bacterium]|nr:ATP-binding cassette domain-containing protein [Actinomycetes bacterium]